jgi:O-antigen/teichoic acid export membrane protein
VSSHLNLRTQLVRNILSNSVFVGLNLLIFFFLTPYIIDVLGKERAGLWFLLGSVTGYFGIVAFGIPGASEKYVAQYLATDEREQVSRTVSMSLSLSLYLAIAGAVAAAALCYFFDDLFEVSRGLVGEARVVMAIVGLDLVFAYPCGLMFNVLAGFNRYDVRNAILIPALIVKTLGYFLAVWWGAGVIGMVLVQLAVNLLSYLAAAVWVFAHAPWLKIRLSVRDRAIRRLLLVYGAYHFLAMAADRIMLYTDRFIIGSMITMAAVTVYHIAAQLRTISRNLSSGLDEALRPAASHLHALDDYGGLQRLLLTGARVLIVSLGALYIVYATWGERFVLLWQYGLTAEDAHQVYCCLVILIAPAFLTVALGAGISIMYGLGKHRPHAVLGVIVAVVNVGLSIWWVYPFGIYGVAAGTALPLFFIRGIYLYHYLPRLTKMSPWHFLRRAWGRPLLGLMPLAAALTGLRFLVQFDSLLMLVLFLAAVGALYFVWAYFVVLTAEEKHLVRDILSTRAIRSAGGETTP